MNKYDFYDFDKAEKIRDDYHEETVDLYNKLFEAREKDNEKALEISIEVLTRHKVKGEKMKQWADEAGFFWY